MKKKDVYRKIWETTETQGISILNSLAEYYPKLVKSNKTLVKKYSKDPDFFTMISLMRFHSLMTLETMVEEWELLFTEKSIGGYTDENESEFDILNVLNLLFPSLTNENHRYLKASLFSLFQWTFHKGRKENGQIVITDVNILKPTEHSEKVDEDDKIPLFALWLGNCFDDACIFVKDIIQKRMK